MPIESCPFCGAERVTVGSRCSSCGQDLPTTPKIEAHEAFGEVYAPPKAELDDVYTGDAETVRRQLLTHETRIRSLGCFFLVPGLLLLFSGLMSVIGGLFTLVAAADAEALAVTFGFGLGYGLFGGLYVWIGRGLRALDRRVRLAATLLLGLGLLAVPIGTLFSAYFLWVVHSNEAGRILTPEYQEIRRQTPHIAYRTSPWLYAILGLFLAGVGWLLWAAATGF